VLWTDNSLRPTIAGSHLECQYELITFGIPRIILPLETGGALKLTDFMHFIEKRKAQESASNQSAVGLIDYPSEFDVLLGRGRPYQEYRGNLHLATVIDMNRSRYQSGKGGHKSVIAGKIVKIINGVGGRF
jgi:hypothetical protein